MNIGQTHMVKILTLLAEHDIDVAELHQQMGCDLEVTSRPHEWCSETAFKECEVYGVTWWPAEGSGGGYNVCLGHSRVVGPIGGGGKQLPLPKAVPLLPETSSIRSVLGLSPGEESIGWALISDGKVVDEGEVALASTQASILREIAVWLSGILLHYMPDLIAVDDPGATPTTVEDSSFWRGALGVEVSNSPVSNKFKDYPGLKQLERIIGLLEGIASVRRPRSVIAVDLKKSFGKIGDDFEETIIELNGHRSRPKAQLRALWLAFHIPSDANEQPPADGIESF